MPPLEAAVGYDKRSIFVIRCRYSLFILGDRVGRRGNRLLRPLIAQISLDIARGLSDRLSNVECRMSKDLLGFLACGGSREGPSGVGIGRRTRGARPRGIGHTWMVFRSAVERPACKAA